MELQDTCEADAEALAALVDSVARERRYLAATVGFSVEGTRAFISSVRASAGVHVVMIASDEIIGWCDIVPHSYEGMKHVGRLGMGIRRDFRGRGFGQKLLAVAVQKAFSSGIERIELEVFASNQSAIRLYETSGFRLEGRKLAARKLDGVTDDLLLYAMLHTA